MLVLDRTPAPLFDPIDDLTGAKPTWRILDDEPIYREVVRDLGVPGLDEPAAPAGDVIAGEVLPPTQALDLGHLFDEPPADDVPPTVPITLLPTTAIPVTGKGGRKRRAPGSARRAS